MRLAGLVLAAFAALPALPTAHAAKLTREQQLLRDIYEELVEINTTDSAGDTTRAARAMAQRLIAGGIPAGDVRVIVPPGAPRKGNLVARLRGRGKKKPLLLLAHIDTVEAKREDWQRDPFTLVEENGYFFARGAYDDKAMAAGCVATLIRLKREAAVLDRDIIVALTADEEIIPSRWNGVAYLLAHHRDLIDAELALNEGATGLNDPNGRPVYLGVQAGEKTFQTFRLEVTSPGGHSSRPTRDNAIYQLAEGLTRLSRFQFPVKLNPVTRRYLARIAEVKGSELAADARDLRAVVQDRPDPRAAARVSEIPLLNATIRTTCVATMFEAGHATNALPQRARAVVNCRILPGESVGEVQATLRRVLADERIALAPDGEPVVPPAPPLEAIIGPVERIAAEMWPGVPVIPMMQTGATDGRLLNVAGIPTYGVTGQYRDLDGNGTHGLNERIRVESLYDGHEFLYRLVKLL